MSDNVQDLSDRKLILKTKKKILSDRRYWIRIEKIRKLIQSLERLMKELEDDKG